MRRHLLLLLALVACGGDDKKTTDGGSAPKTDASTDASTDAAAAAPDCATYCSTIQANCAGANAQYPAMTNCMAACASFALGTSGAQTGNTLGCRLYHAGAPAIANPALHCPHAGPGGDLTTVVDPPGTCGDACTSFCTLEIKACGTTVSAPATGQYTDMNACLSTCKAFPNANHLYSPSSKGDSLACRLYHATNAAITGNATAHCPHTGPSPSGATNPCLAGSTASP